MTGGPDIERVEVDAADRPRGDVADRYRLARVTRAEGAPFARAYAALDGEFGPRGEVERRTVLEAWLARDPGTARVRVGGGLTTRYHLLEATTDAGELAGVRDCHVVVDEARRVVVVYLAHVLVLTAHRRTGLSALMRAITVTLGRRAVTELGPGPAELLLAAEMEPAVMDEPATIVRLVSYGRAGFAAIEPEVLPYAQPDFRDPAIIGDDPLPLPLLAVARRVGHEHETSLPSALAEAFVRHLYDGVFASHCRAEHLAPARDHALGALREAGLTAVPLLGLPRGPEDQAALAPLARKRVLSFYSPAAH